MRFGIWTRKKTVGGKELERKMRRQREVSICLSSLFSSLTSPILQVFPARRQREVFKSSTKLGWVQLRSWQSFHYTDQTFASYKYAKQFFFESVSESSVSVSFRVPAHVVCISAWLIRVIPRVCVCACVRARVCVCVCVCVCACACACIQMAVYQWVEDCSSCHNLPQSNTSPWFNYATVSLPRWCAVDLTGASVLAVWSKLANPARGATRGASPPWQARALSADWIANAILASGKDEKMEEQSQLMIYLCFPSPLEVGNIAFFCV